MFNDNELNEPQMPAAGNEGALIGIVFAAVESVVTGGFVDLGSSTPTEYATEP